MKIEKKNMTVAELIAALSRFPADATVEPYDGEATGIRIDGPDGTLEIGFIKTYRDVGS